MKKYILIVFCVLSLCTFSKSKSSSRSKSSSNSHPINRFKSSRSDNSFFYNTLKDTFIENNDENEQNKTEEYIKKIQLKIKALKEDKTKNNAQLIAYLEKSLEILMLTKY